MCILQRGMQVPKRIKRVRETDQREDDGKMMDARITFLVSNECLNMLDSYGTICVHCNSCGRFDTETMLQDRLEMYKWQLQEQVDLEGWWEGAEELQRKNRDANIKDYKRLICKTEVEIEKWKEMGK